MWCYLVINNNNRSDLLLLSMSVLLNPGSVPTLRTPWLLSLLSLLKCVHCAKFGIQPASYFSYCCSQKYKSSLRLKGLLWLTVWGHCSQWLGCSLSLTSPCSTQLANLARYQTPLALLIHKDQIKDCSCIAGMIFFFEFHYFKKFYKRFTI